MANQNSDSAYQRAPRKLNEAQRKSRSVMRPASLAVVISVQ